MRINISGGSNTLYYLLKDHLGSASVVTDASGNIPSGSEQRYYPYGENRLTPGTMFTDILFTGQREITGLGIYHYGARFYSPKLGRFLSPDTIVPGMANPQALNRYSYVLGNPLRYTDPTGHYCVGDDEDCVDVGGGTGKSTPTPPPTPTQTPSSTPSPTSTPTPSSTPCPVVVLACQPTATNTPIPTNTSTPTSTPTPYSGPTIGPGTPSTPWEFPFAIEVADPFDLAIDIAGVVGDGASFVGVPGKIVWAVTEGAEVIGIGKDVYDLATKKDATGISSTFFFHAAEKLVPDLMRIQNPGIISFAGNVWSISQNITITRK